MLNNLTKLMKILMKKNSMQQVLFYVTSSASSIKIFSKYKKLGSIKKFP